MYSVYLIDYNSTPTADTPTPSKEKLYIYDPITYDEGLAIEEPTLSIEANKVGTFNCTLPPTNYGFGRIIKGLTRLVVEKDNKIKFMGRIFNEDRDLYLNQTIEAEGALGYLNDSLTEKKTLVGMTLPELLSYIFTKHNDKFPNEPWKQFTLKVCTAKFVGYDTTDVSSEKLTTYSINFDKSLELVMELVNLAKGVLKIEYNEENGKWDVYVYDKYNLPVTSNQPIEFGANLLDLVQTYDQSDICTAVAPFGGELIQTPAEIGEVIAGWNPDTGNPINNEYAHWYSDAALARDNNTGEYDIYDIPSGWHRQGYWVFELDISEYNRLHPNRPLKKIYISWRAYKYAYGDDDNYVVDNAWRIDFVSSGNQFNLGYHSLTKPNEQFEADINEEIDLSSAQYIGATRIRVGGWGMLLSPVIKRDASIVEELDKLSITKCDAFPEDSQGLRHPANSPYLYSDKLIRLYGLIEKKLEYEVEDSLVPVKEWAYVNDRHDNDPRGTSVFYRDTRLGYDISQNDKDNEGNYQRRPYNGDSCIEFTLPDLGNPHRPRALFLCSREGPPEDDGDWRLNGQWAVYDTSFQVLAFQSCDTDNGEYRSIKNFCIDLSLPEYYGAKYVRISGFGGDIGVDVRPSDDEISRNRLMELAKSYLTDYQWEKITIEATAVDLNVTDEQWEEFDICTNVPIISEIHGLQSSMALRALDIRLDRPEDNVIKLGYDNDEYLSEQLAESSRLASIAKTIEERRNNS